MAEMAMAEGIRHKRTPKVLSHIEIKPKMGGGHIITHHYTSYQHEPKPHNFGPDDGERAMKHIAKHAGLPHPEIAEHEGSEPDSYEAEEKEMQ